MSARAELLEALADIDGVVLLGAEEWDELPSSSLRPLRAWAGIDALPEAMAVLAARAFVCVDDGTHRQLWASTSPDGSLLVDVCHTRWLVGDVFSVLDGTAVAFPKGSPDGAVLVALLWQAVLASAFLPDDLWEAARDAWDDILVHQRDEMLAPFPPLCRTLLETLASSSDIRVAIRAHRALKRARARARRRVLVHHGAHRTALLSTISPLHSSAVVALPEGCETLALESAGLLTAAGHPAHPVSLGGTRWLSRWRYLTRVVPLRLTGAVAVCHGWPLGQFCLPRPSVAATPAVDLGGLDDAAMGRASRRAAAESVWVKRQRAARVLTDASSRAVAAGATCALEQRMPRSWSAAR